MPNLRRKYLFVGVVIGGLAFLLYLKSPPVKIEPIPKKEQALIAVEEVEKNSEGVAVNKDSAANKDTSSHAKLVWDGRVYGSGSPLRDPFSVPEEMQSFMQNKEREKNEASGAPLEEKEHGMDIRERIKERKGNIRTNAALERVSSSRQEADTSIRILGVVWYQNHGRVLVHYAGADRMMTEGERIGNVTVMEIQKDYVRLSSGEVWQK